MPVTGILSASPSLKVGVHAGCVIAELALILDGSEGGCGRELQ